MSYSLSSTVSSCPGCSTYRVGGEDVEVWLVGLQQLTQRAEETLHQQVDALTVTGQQQLLHRLHRYTHIPGDHTDGERMLNVCVRCVVTLRVLTRSGGGSALG